MCSFVRFQLRFLDDSSHGAASMESGIEIEINMVIHGTLKDTIQSVPINIIRQPVEIMQC